MSYYYPLSLGAEHSITIPANSFIFYSWCTPWILREESKINYQASVSAQYSADTVREQLRVLGVLALVETFGFPLERIAINVKLPLNRRKHAFIVVYRDTAKRMAQLVLECIRATSSAYQREQALAKTIRKAKALGAAWALCAVGEECVLAVNTHDPKNVVSLPLLLR